MLDGPVEATLRRPVPLDRPLGASVHGSAVALLDGEDLIVEAREVPEFEIEVPEPVGPAEAREAMSRYRGLDQGPFSRCFVCGLAREDSFEVFSGRVEGRDVVASTWTPPSWTAGEGGRVRPEFVWAALDCPTFFGAYVERRGAADQLSRPDHGADRVDPEGGRGARGDVLATGDRRPQGRGRGFASERRGRGTRIGEGNVDRSQRRMMGQPVVHFEVIGSDGERLQKYYGELFDWDVNSDNEMKYGLVDRESNSNGEGIGLGGGIGRAPTATRATSPSTSKSPTSRPR